MSSSPSNKSVSAAQATAQGSYTAMSVGDVEAIGAHCEMAYCHQLDFLPFRCDSCKGFVLPFVFTHPARSHASAKII